MFVLTIDTPFRQSIKPWLLFLSLIAAGLAGNYFKFPIFLNVDFIFGSIFAMLALQIFGSGRGILASAIIAGYTWILWNHPYAIIIMTAETAAVGWLMTRRRIGMVLADTIYWLCIGMPLVYLFYHIVMHVPFSSTSIIMIKQAVNGITNALVARLVFTGLTLRYRSSLTSFREILYDLLTFFVLFPALVMLGISSRTEFAETENNIRATLVQGTQLTGQYLETWVLSRETAVVNLAEMAASASPGQMQSYLELIKKSDDNFLRIGLNDKEATTIAYCPLVDELGQNNIGKNFADRPYIPRLQQTLKPMLSEVVMGRIGTPMPFIAMLAPVVIQGAYGGYITGVLNLEQIRDHLNRSIRENAMLYTLVDKNGNVIMSNRVDQKVMTRFEHGRGAINFLDAGIRQWVPELPSNTSIMERWKRSFYIAETTIGRLAEWKLILEQPTAPFQVKLNNIYSGRLVMLFLILLGVLLLAELLTRRSVATLENLCLITHDLPDRLAMDGSNMVWPESGITEVAHLIDNFREMAVSLIRQFREVQHSQDTLWQAFTEIENRVHKRTAELDDANKALTAEISERKRAESEKAELQAQNYLLQKSESLHRMAGAIAHHFNNHLQVVIGNIEMAIDDLPPGVIPLKSLNSAMEAARRAADVSGLMLTYLGQTTGRHEPTNLSEVCRQSLILLHAAIPENVILQEESPSSGPFIHANAGQIQLVLTNLVTNAWESIGDCQGTISVTVKTVTSSEIRASNRFPVDWQAQNIPYACLEVSDTGCGIPFPDIGKIFDPFFTSKFTGRGMGLSVAKGIIGAHSGGVTVESRSGSGSVFRVFLPLSAEKIIPETCLDIKEQ